MRAATDFRCTTCEGQGDVYVGVYCSRYPGDTRGCGCGGRMCGAVSAECPDCEGDGRTRCDWCGEDPATEVGLSNDQLCRGCADEERAELAPPAERVA